MQESFTLVYNLMPVSWPNGTKITIRASAWDFFYYLKTLYIPIFWLQPTMFNSNGSSLRSFYFKMSRLTYRKFSHWLYSFCNCTRCWIRLNSYNIHVRSWAELLCGFSARLIWLHVLKISTSHRSLIRNHPGYAMKW